MTRQYSPEIQALAQNILANRKYRDLGLPMATVCELLEMEIPRHKSLKAAEQVVRKKLHQIVAPYLGDPDYATEQIELRKVFASGDRLAIRAKCTQLLSTHASTRERIHLLDHFYDQIFSKTGLPHSILDLACGLHPFSLPWMKLPEDVVYYAYDIHQPRIDLINTFFECSHLPQQAIAEDILISPPQQTAEVAFFFKEAHRFEQRQHGCNRAFWQALSVSYLLVSLPTASLNGRRSLLAQQRRLVYDTLKGLPWQVDEILFDNEIVFVMDKSHGA